MGKSEDLEESPPGYDKRPGEITEKSDGDRRASQTRRKSSVVDPEVLTGEIYDERFDSTKRGLKSRHAQMIALGEKNAIYLHLTA